MQISHSALFVMSLTAATMMDTVFWVETPCSAEIVRRFGRMYRLHLRGRRKQKNRLCLPPYSADFMLGLLLGPEDRGNIFLRNAGLCPNYTALQFRRSHSSQFVP
jgi:hypothetical protein